MPTATALVTALVVTIARMALFGSVLEHLRGRRSTAGIFLAGIGLAAAAALVAALKFALTR